MCRFFSVVMFVFLYSSRLFAETLFSVAVDEADWRFEEKEFFHCTMSQTVPLLGDLLVTARVGKALSLDIETSQIRHRPDSIRLWLEYTRMKTRFITDIETKPVVTMRGLELKAPSLPVHELLSWLSRQARITIIMDWYRKAGSDFQPSEPLRIEVPVVNAASVLDNMTACSNRLLPRGFDELGQYALHYSLGDWVPDSNQQQWIQDTARYLIADPEVSVVMLDGHADDTPFRESTEAESRIKNLELSKKRAESLRNLLKKLLIESGLEYRPEIRVRYHGSRYPVADNAIESGRKLNRRVEVTLKKELNDALKESEVQQPDN